MSRKPVQLPYHTVLRHDGYTLDVKGVLVVVKSKQGHYNYTVKAAGYPIKEKGHAKEQ